MVDSWRLSLVLECGDIVVLTRRWDQNWPQVFSSLLLLRRAALFNDIYRGGGGLHGPLGLL